MLVVQGGVRVMAGLSPKYVKMEPVQRETGVGLTPMAVIRWAEREAGLKFTIDGCASPGHERLERYVSPAEDFIKTGRDFTGETVWLNPPYVAKRSNRYSTADFVRRASDIRARYGCPVAILLEANMAGTAYFNDYIGCTPARRRDMRTEVYFHPGRIAFENYKGTNTKASILAVLQGTEA